jgi:5-methylcytosine-specific restriction endonuclease McrA
VLQPLNQLRKRRCQLCDGDVVRVSWTPSKRRPMLKVTNGPPRFGVDHRHRPPIGTVFPILTSARTLYREALRYDPCAYCGRSRAGLGPGTIDHIVPLGARGPDVPFNWTGACEHCNKSKGAEPLLLYMLSRVGGTVPPFHATPAAVKRGAAAHDAEVRSLSGRASRRRRARSENRPEVPWEGIPGWAGPGD